MGLVALEQEVSAHPAERRHGLDRPRLLGPTTSLTLLRFLAARLGPLPEGPVDAKTVVGHAVAARLQT